MTLLSSELLKAIFRTVGALPHSSIENVQAVLETATDLTPILLRQVLQSVALPQERVILNELIAVWSQEPVPPSPALVAAGLQGAAYTSAEINKEQNIELVWTGPSSGRSFRRTDQALLQVIRAANVDLLLVTFAAYKVPLLFDAIRAALDRGVTVRFVAESMETSGGKVSFDAANAFRELAAQIKFYVWPREKREKDAMGNFGSLHAKCALADKELLLVSSANFTEHALALNMEMGLLVNREDLVSQVRHYFDFLIRENVVQRT